jgi:hypothetical protein
MMRFLPLSLLLAACAGNVSAPETALMETPDALPNDQAAPPPTAVPLTMTPVVSGGSLTFTVTGVPAGTRMNFIASANTTGAGLCPPAIAPACLAVPAGFITLGNAVANGAGTATFTLTVPTAVPARLEFQAYGANAGNYFLSNGIIRDVFVGTADADADGLTNLNELSRGTGITDADSDDDGLNDGAEVTATTNPLDSDTDDDGVGDGGEVLSYGTNPRSTDTDGDGLGDGDEIFTHSTNPLIADTDGDFAPDGYEVYSLGTNPTAFDTDGDGLGDGSEAVTYGTSPVLTDSDADGLTDGTEVLGTNPTNPLDVDSDADGQYDGFEDANQNGALDFGETNPNLADTDADGLDDGFEYGFGLNPLNADTDGDELSDGEEILLYGTNPQVFDTDSDGLYDGFEVDLYFTDPNDADTDNDGLSDGAEFNAATDPLTQDTDSDGLLDGAEIAIGSNPLASDTDGDDLTDGAEFFFGTNPTAPDTDADGLNDGYEVILYGTNPLDTDSDDDGLSDGAEADFYGTDPLDADTDNGGINDGAEITAGTDPLNATDDSAGGSPRLVINEVDYDQAGTDGNTFVEIYNAGTAAADLTNIALVGANGSNNSEYGRWALSGAATSLPAGGYLVVRNSTVVIPPTVPFLNVTGDFLQNGAPDSIALIDTVNFIVLDALSYEGSMTSVTLTGFPGPVSLVEGSPYGAADTNDNLNSLSRLPNGTDTDNASADWRLGTNITPGTANF